jgi:hypothetical protein
MDRMPARLLIIFCLALIAAACGEKSPSSLAVGISISPASAALAAGQTMKFTASVTNDSSGVNWSASVGTIDASGNYTAPPVAGSTKATVTVTSKKDPGKSANASVNIVMNGQLSATANPLVALYTISPVSGDVTVEFGLTDSYGLRTWTQPVPPGGGTVRMFVAGMKANTRYHLRGVVKFRDGTQYRDPDMTFTTGSIPQNIFPPFTATTTPGMVPQPGVEMVNTIQGALMQAVAVDLSGNIVW